MRGCLIAVAAQELSEKRGYLIAVAIQELSEKRGYLITVATQELSKNNVRILKYQGLTLLRAYQTIFSVTHT